MSGVVVGIGCSSGADALEIAGLVGAVLEGRRARALAVPARRAAQAAVREAAAMLGLGIVPVAEEAIEAVQDRCLTRPCRAVRAVAEGAALVVAGEGSVLLGPRRKTRRVTCALASLNDRVPRAPAVTAKACSRTTTGVGAEPRE